jgi:hypothetical protein
VREVATERLKLKAIALVLAALLWVVVGTRQPTEGYARVRVIPELDSSLVLLDGTRELQARVAGRASDLVKLYAAPLVVRRRVGGNVPDTLVLDVTPSDVQLPPDLSGSIRVVDVQPRSVVLRFESSATRRVPVADHGRIRLQPAPGLPSVAAESTP